MRYAHILASFVLVSAIALMGCKDDQQVAADGTNGTNGSNGSNGSSTYRVSNLTLPSGTSIGVTLNTALSSKTASVGDSWSGTVINSEMRDGVIVIPAGSSVSGTVTAVKAARKGDRAMLDLGLRSVTISGQRYNLNGSTESVVAGSTRARNLGAIAGSAAGGALIGKATSGTTKGAIVGGLIGGGVAAGVVAASDGYQVLLNPGISLTFTTSEALAVRP